jgi:hypothetical protein
VIGSAGEERWETLAARLNRPLLELLRGPPRPRREDLYQSRK